MPHMPRSACRQAARGCCLRADRTPRIARHVMANAGQSLPGQDVCRKMLPGDAAEAAAKCSNIARGNALRRTGLWAPTPKSLRRSTPHRLEPPRRARKRVSVRFLCTGLLAASMSGQSWHNLVGLGRIRINLGPKRANLLGTDPAGAWRFPACHCRPRGQHRLSKALTSLPVGMA